MDFPYSELAVLRKLLITYEENAFFNLFLFQFLFFLKSVIMPSLRRCPIIII